MKKTDIGQNVVYEGNKDAFLAWCLNKAVQQELEADTDVICSFLSANVELWVQQAMTWDYCYTMMSSIIYANNEKKKRGGGKSKKITRRKETEKRKIQRYHGSEWWKCKNNKPKTNKYYRETTVVCIKV
jgi:hypothetical protein